MRALSIILVWLGLVALAAFATLFLPNLADYEQGQVVLLVLAAVLLMGIGLAIRPEKRLPLVADPVTLFFVFQAQFFVVGPLALPLFNYKSYRVTYEATIFGMVGFLLMVVCFLWAYHSRIGVILSDLLPAFQGGRMKAPARWYEFLLLGVGSIGIVAYVIQAGGIDQALRYGYGSRYRPNNALYQIPYHAFILATLVLGWRLVGCKRRSTFDKGLFAALLLFDVAFFAFVVGARKNLFFVVVVLFGMWILHRPKNRLPRLVMAVLAPLLLLYVSVWGMVRAQPIEQLLQGRAAPATVASGGPVYFGYLNSVSEPYAVVCLVYNVFPNVEPFRFGKTLAVTVLGFIPRAYWPEKPVGLGKDLTRYTDGIFYSPTAGHSVTPTLVGDFWVNFGWVGIIIGGLVYGLVCRTMADYMAQGLQHGVQTVPARILGGAFFLSGLVEVRSDTATVLAHYLIGLPLLLIGLAFFDLDHARDEREEATVPVPGPMLGAPRLSLENN